MFGEFEIREIPLSLSSARLKAEEFLNSQGLRMDNLDRFFGVFDSADNLVGGGGLHGSVIKCVALAEQTRGESLANSLISRIRQAAAEENIFDLTLFTKPENEEVFSSMAFHTVGRAPKALLMESNPRGITSYTNRLKSMARPYAGGNNGVIAMNCNPLTQGHLYLIATAAGQVDRLFIIPVRHGLTDFSYAERSDMLSRIAARFDNVTICPGSIYTISQATFPTYFIKDLNDAAPTQMELDLDIFCRHIAPALGAGKRFAGTEPTDPLTQCYNRTMQRLLPPNGIEVIEIPRIESAGQPVSASRVRRLLAQGMAGDAINLLPTESIPYLLAHAACRALTDELELTPKPGLVDLHDNGAHTDMDVSTMRQSIESCKPYFVKMADAAMQSASTAGQPASASKSILPATEIDGQLRAIGIEAEQAMLAATGGVNTHRGALFSIGLAVAAAAVCLASTPEGDRRLTPDALRRQIMTLAAALSAGKHAKSATQSVAVQADTAQEQASHGAKACERYGIKGAAQLAEEGYPQLFDSWLPMYRAIKSDPMARHRLLCRIMADIDDTNLYHRGGLPGAQYARQCAVALAESCTMEALAQANADFVARNLSPGGAADMLALTLLTDSLTCNQSD